MSGFVEEEDVREDKVVYEGTLAVKGGRKFGFFGPVQWSRRTGTVKESFNELWEKTYVLEMFADEAKTKRKGNAALSNAM
eukprot:g419.t1